MTEANRPGSAPPGRRSEGSTGLGSPAQIRSFVARHAAQPADPVARRLARLARLYAMLAEANTAILHAETARAVFDAVCEVAVGQREFDLAWVGWAGHDGMLRPSVARGPAASYARDLVLDARGPGPAARALRQGTPVVVPDVSADPTFHTAREAREHGLGSLCALPLRQGDGTIGVLCVYTEELDGFDHERLTVLEALAADVSFALQALAVRDAAAFRADLLASVGDAVAAADHEGRVTYMNRTALRFGGWTLDDVLGRPVTDVFPAPEAGTSIAEVMRAVSSGRAWNGELAFELPDRRRMWIMANLTPIREGDGAGGVIGVATDITARVHDRHRLEFRERMQTEVSRLGQMALATHELGAVTAAIAEHVGDDQTLIRASWGSYPVAAGAAPVTSGKLDLHRLLDEADGPLEIEDFDNDPRFVAALPPEGSEYPSAVIARIGSPTHRYGTLTALQGERRRFQPDELRFLESLATILSTAVERAEADRRLTAMGLHDALTGLPNRVLLRDRIDRATAKAAGGPHTLAVLLVDLDRFKLLNDALGHEAGDRLLVAVARRLQHAVSASDTVARLGGDEFAVLCESAGDLDDVFDLASSLSTALAPPFEIDGTEVFVTASIGISAHRDGTTTGDTFLREADAAMYRAKETGRAGYEIYDPALQARAAHRLETTTALRRALDRDELIVAWQPEVPLTGPAGGDPRVDLGAGELWAEALVRWHHPQLGVVGPAAFIELAEETGLIVPLGEVVLHGALRQLRRWLSRGGSAPRQVSINLSPRQLSQSGLVGTVEAALAEHDVDPAHVVFEITESAVMDNPDAAVRRLHQLHDLGLGLAVDDFGTGYSSLSYLRRLPVSQLKIDRSFISGITHHDADEAIVRGTIELAHALGLVVVAEGVETVEQRDRLREMGCDRAQGYLWSRPVPAAQFDEALTS